MNDFKCLHCLLMTQWGSLTMKLHIPPRIRHIRIHKHRHLGKEGQGIPLPPQFKKFITDFSHLSLDNIQHIEEPTMLLFVFHAERGSQSAQLANVCPDSCYMLIFVDAVSTTAESLAASISCLSFMDLVVVDGK